MNFQTVQQIGTPPRKCAAAAPNLYDNRSRTCFYLAKLIGAMRKGIMFRKFANKLQYASERIVVWALRRVLYNYSAVVATEFGKVGQFRSEVIAVAFDHWTKLADLNERVSKLERAA